MREFRARSRSTRPFFFYVVLLVALVWLCGSFAKKCGKANKSCRKCAGKKYILSEDLARAAELQVGSTVCRVHWDEIRRSNNRCSVPRGNHSRRLKKQRIPPRLFAVLDAIGATCHGYKPGTRWCYNCCTRVDEETMFTLHPDYKPPVLRSTEQDGNKQTSDDKLQKILQFTRSPILRLHKNLKQQHSSGEGLQKVQNHFQLLFQRLKFLEEACGIDLQNLKSQQTSMAEIQTSFGVVKINCYGEVTVDKTVWNRMATAIHDLTQLSENSFDQLMGKFQISLQHHYESSDAVPLYDPGQMKEFADKCAPGLFNVILQSILREDPRLSEEHRVLQEKRTVVLLHIIAYFRSQKTNTLQREEGLFIQQHGASRDVINSGRILGFSTSPRDVDGQKSRLLREQPVFVHLQISNALQDKSLMIYLLDDFHNIQTVRLPGANMKLSIATHMASNLLDIHQNVPAILLPSNKSKIHRIVTVHCKGQNKQCRGGIDTNYLSQLLQDCNGALKSTFLASLRDDFRSLKPRDIQAQLKEFRY